MRKTLILFLAVVFALLGASAAQATTAWSSGGQSYFPNIVDSNGGYGIGNFEGAITMVISSAGEVTNAVAKTDAFAFIGPADVTTSGGTYTKTRGATGNWYLAKTAAADNTYITADITQIMRTATSKGWKLTSIKVLSGVSTQVLDNNWVNVSKVVYADNVAPAVTDITVTGAQLTVAAGTVGQPKVETVTVTTPAWQNTALTKWAVDIWINSTSQASTVYRFYGMFLYFTVDPL